MPKFGENSAFSGTLNFGEGIDIMEAIKLHAYVDQDGILRVQLPADVQGLDCEVVVLYRLRHKMTPSQWSAFVNETYGSLADDPIERGPELPTPERDEIE